MILQVLRLTPRQFLELPEYSCSLPTGTTIGKRWRRLDGAHDREFIAGGGKPKWIIGEYLNSSGPAKVSIYWYKPVITVRADV